MAEAHWLALSLKVVVGADHLPGVALHKPGKPWIDPHAPDGVTILAPYEQYPPSAHPGLIGGETSRPMELFDLQKDPGEQRDVAAEHADVVARLKALYDEMDKLAAPQAGRINSAPAVMMDLFATLLNAAKIAPLGDRVIDGRDIMPLFVGDAASPHATIFGQQGPRLATVRDARWKLHVLPPRDNFANWNWQFLRSYESCPIGRPTSTETLDAQTQRFQHAIRTDPQAPRHSRRIEGR